MTIHQTLPTAIYLLAYDTRKNKLAKKAWLDYLVHGAALSELALDGYLTAIGGHPQATAVGEPADAVLGAVLDEIRRAGPAPGNGCYAATRSKRWPTSSGNSRITTSLALVTEGP